MTELTPEYIELVRQYLSKHKPKVELEAKLQDERRYYYIEFRGFSTIVPSSDCQNMDDALHYATHEKLQAWYIIDEKDQHTDVMNSWLVKEFTHDQYCDWLRKKGM